MVSRITSHFFGVKLQFLVLTLTVITLVGCTTGGTKQTKTTAIAENTLENVRVDSFDNSLEKMPETSSGIRFPNVVLEIDSITLYTQNNMVPLEKSDTALRYVDIGESIEGKKIRFRVSNQFDLSVFQRHENSVTVMAEGPHCDLIDWKHYDSEWLALQLRDSEFETLQYTEKIVPECLK